MKNHILSQITTNQSHLLPGTRVEVEFEERKPDLALFAAIDTDDGAAMALAVEGGASISSARNNNGDSPMMIAASIGEVGVMAWLVEHGADVNAAASHGTTALHHAARGGHVAAMEWLV
jgi:ankyrin repeat protein